MNLGTLEELDAFVASVMARSDVVRRLARARRARRRRSPAPFLYVNETSPPWYERLRYPLHYAAFVRVHAREHNLDPALMAAVIYQESKFDPKAARRRARSA